MRYPAWLNGTAACIAFALLGFAPGCDHIIDLSKGLPDGSLPPGAEGGAWPGQEECLKYSTDQIIVDKLDRVDLLFVIDESLSMIEEQAKIRSQFKRIIQVLTSGDRNPDDGITEGKDFMPVKDLNLGLVTTDLGLVKIEPQDSPDPDYCRDLGDDGIMQHTPHPTIEGVNEAPLNCIGPFNNFFLTFKPGMNVTQTATDFACIAGVGAWGCGFEQQLEAPLKALWPSQPTDDQKEDFKNLAAGKADEIKFLAGDGHGDQHHAEFLRATPYNPDAVEAKKLSLLAVVVVSDEEDCSVGANGNQDMLRRPESDKLPGWMDATMAQNLNLRCYYDDLRPEGERDKYPVQRYIAGFKALRPGMENLVVFAAIVGVPVEAIKTDVEIDTNQDGEISDAERAEYLQSILYHPFMQEQEDPTNPGYLQKACISNNFRYSTNIPRFDAGIADGGINDGGTNDGYDSSANTYTTAAEPGRRFVQVAAGFGANGVVRSICEPDYTPAVDAIVEAISRQVGVVCYPHKLIRNSDGKVDCEMTWEMPEGENCTSQPQFQDYLTALGPQDVRLEDGGVRKISCLVNQIPVLNPEFGTGVEGPFPALDQHQFGWYYDDFSASIKRDCKGYTQRIAFRLESNIQDPPPLTNIKLECPKEAYAPVQLEGSGQALGEECSAAKPCDKKFFCHPQSHVCVQACSTSAPCPPLSICDSRAKTIAGAGKAICVDVSCK